MHIVLLSGGSGKRLWPLSNDIRSKQFLKIFPQADGTRLSMIQRVYRQILAADPAADITVATSQAQASTLRHQLGSKVDLSVEPCRRDTFPAIALVSAYLHDVKRVAEDDVVAVCPVDPYVEDAYFAAVKELAQLAADGAARLMLMGVEPTYPSEKYGYILPAAQSRVSRVAAFREKPDEATARHYIAQGALWNSGVFAYRLGYVLGKARELLDFQSYQDLYDRYDSLEKISFDYAVAEREPSIGVLRYQGAWRDLGTWSTLTSIMEESTIGDVLTDDACHDLHVVNEMDVPILCMGIEHAIVAASPEGILVADKTRSSHMKPYVEQIDQEIRYAEKSWGTYEVLDIGPTSRTIKLTLAPGHAMHYHSHEHRDETWTIISGTGRALVDGAWQDIRAGAALRLPRGTKHKLEAKTPLTVIEVQTGGDISAEDKIHEKEPAG